MHKYILKRLLMMIPIILGVTFVIFFMTYITPGDPAVLTLGEAAPAEAVEALREEMGLNDPFLVRYFNYVINMVQGDLGNSFVTRRGVIDEILDRFPTTLMLAFYGTILSVIIGIPLGIISATKQYSIFDNAATAIGLLGVSIPNFWLGLMLILLFSLNLGWLPPSGLDTPAAWILPVITLGTGSAALVMRITRSSMLEVVRQDYIRTARAKGQKESIIIWKHALRNAMIPVVTAVGLDFGFLLGGAVLTESIYALPGIGRFMVESITRRDFPIIQGGVLFLAITFSFVNLFVDVLYAYIDPRIKSQYK
ncbi:MAG: ABC transporter permease [Defluviitaleaceae bacterium]|nr:ABC transporter permease [Defluviitaleaceae bacterium]